MWLMRQQDINRWATCSVGQSTHRLNKTRDVMLKEKLQLPKKLNLTFPTALVLKIIEANTLKTRAASVGFHCFSSGFRLASAHVR